MANVKISDLALVSAATATQELEVNDSLVSKKVTVLQLLQYIENNITKFVSKTSNTGSSYIPTGTTAQRDASPSTGYFRFNTSSNLFEGYNGTSWSDILSAPTDNSVTTNKLVDSNVTYSKIQNVNSGKLLGRKSTSTGVVEEINISVDSSNNTTFPANVLVTSGSLVEKQISMAANDIDLNTGNYFTKTISTATTFTISNIPTTSSAISFILDLTNGGAGTITWWANVKWAGGTAPTLTVSGRDTLGFFTYNNGTTWTGLVLGKDIK